MGTLAAFYVWDEQDQGFVFWVEDETGRRVVGDQLEAVSVEDALLRMGYSLAAPFKMADEEVFEAPVKTISS